MKNIISVYEEILSEQRKGFPMGTWTEREEGIRQFSRCFEYLIYEKLKLTREDLLNALTKSFFAKYKLSGAVHVLFGDKVSEAAWYGLPKERILVWELKKFPAICGKKIHLIKSERYAG